MTTSRDGDISGLNARPGDVIKLPPTPEGNDSIPRGRRPLAPRISPALAMAAIVLAGSKDGREKTERVVTGEAIPRAPKKGPQPPHVVPKGKLPRRLFKSRPVVRVGDPETAA